MNIPSEVLAAAETAYYSRVTHSEYDSYLVIAEWARKEALREAEAAIKARLQGSISVNEDAWEAYWEARDQATDAIRALLNGGTS